VILLIVFFGCAEKGMVRNQQMEIVREPPKIASMVDLGGMPVLSSGTVNETMSDGRFTPGEWFVVKGRYLSDDSTEVRIGEIQTPVVAHLDTGLLVRMPRSVSPSTATTLKVSTTFGSDSIAFRPQVYLVVSDPSGNALRFFRTVSNDAGTPGFEPECDAVPFERVRAHVLSRSGALLYAVAGAKESGDDRPSARELRVVHMGAREHPIAVGSVPFTTVDGPASMVMSDDGNYLIVLTQTELLIFDVLDEAAPRLTSQLNLRSEGMSEGGYSSLALVDGGRAAVLLDGMANRLTVIDLRHKKAPRIASHMTVLEDSIPRLVDVVADRGGSGMIHVVSGPNLRLAKNLFHKFAPKLFEHLKSGAPAAEGQLLTFRLEANTLQEVRRVALPKRTVPLHLYSTQRGDTFVSAVDFAIADLAEVDSVMGGIRTATEIMTDAVKLGSILRVDTDGNTEKLADGVSLFLTLTEIPDDNRVVALVMRIAVKKFPPSLGVMLSIDTLDESGKRIAEQRLRKLSWTSAIPPYTTPSISF
jgi:hypothetical protein